MEPRSISPGDVISGVFRIYRQHAAVLLAASLVVSLITLLFEQVGGARIEIGDFWFEPGVPGTGNEVGDPQTPVTTTAAVLGSLLSLVITLVTTTFYQGLVVELVRDVQDGRRDVTVQTMLRGVAPVVVTLIALSFVSAVAIVIVILALTVPFVLLRTFLDTTPLAFALIPLLIVPVLLLVTFWWVAAPVVVVERRGPFAALARSAHLVRGNGWRVFGALVLAVLIAIAVAIPVGLLAAVLGPAGPVVTFVSRVLAAPVSALLGAVLYFALLRARGAADTPEAAAIA